MPTSAPIEPTAPEPTSAPIEPTAPEPTSAPMTPAEKRKATLAAKKAAAAGNGDASNPAEVSEELAIDTSSTKVVIEYHNPGVGLTHREFSEDVHGTDFQDKAREFATKFNGTLVSQE